MHGIHLWNIITTIFSLSVVVVPTSTEQGEFFYRQWNCSASNWCSPFLYQSALILSLAAFPFQSANLDVHVTTILFVQKVRNEKCLFKKEIYFGFKVHALITLEGYITAFEITTAFVDNREGLRDFAENCPGMIILGDEGYIGKTLFDDMRSKGIDLMSLKPSHYKKNWFTKIRQLIFRFSRGVKTVFS